MKTLILLLTFIIISCTNIRYTVKYSVSVRYEDNTTDTLNGSAVVMTNSTSGIAFTLSSRLRAKPCLLLVNGSELDNTIANLACGVKSFSVIELSSTKVIK